QLIEKLKRNEHLYKQAEVMANMGNYSMNLMNGEIEWTDQLYKIYGLDPQAEKITLERFYTLIHPEDRESVDASIEAFYKEGYADYTFRIITANGDIKILRSISQLEHDDKGRPVLVIGTEQDVTEHQNLVNRLEKSEWLNRHAQAIARLGNWSFNLKTGDLYWSDELFRIYEFEPPEQISFDLFVSFIHPDDKEDVIAYYNECLQQKKPYNKKHRVVLRNGKVKTLHRKGDLRLDADGEVLEFFGTTQDITEQQAAEMELLEKQNFIQKIADATPTILYLYNVAENRFVYINREVFYVLGYTADEVLNAGTKATTLLYHPDDYHLLPQRPESDTKFQHADSMMQYECRMQNKEGEWCWLLVREVMFKTDEEGNIVEILGAALDISKRKEMEKALMQNAYQLEQSNASLEEFAYVASHDLKEPLRKISTFGDRLLHTQLELLSEDGKTYLKKIVEASQRMQNMISDLLSISMITGDNAFEPYSLQSILEEVLQTLEYKIEQKGAVINAQTLPEINIIPSQFRQLFQNLLSNSLKFVKPDVQPQITIKHTFLQPEETESLQLKKAGSYLRLQFTDNGIGFDEEYAGKIFAIFQRLHGRSEYEGTGIGLAICKKIVEHHGGIIYASAQEQQGATFTIILPA
ncbi:MAG: PAS domain-containing sensor histidine kinase, partial [Chitinophagaceae bacterium]